MKNVISARRHATPRVTRAALGIRGLRGAHSLHWQAPPPWQLGNPRARSQLMTAHDPEGWVAVYCLRAGEKFEISFKNLQNEK